MTLTSNFYRDLHDMKDGEETFENFPSKRVDCIDGEIVDGENNTILGTVTVTFTQVSKRTVQIRKHIFVRWAGQKDPEFENQEQRDEAEREMIKEHFAKVGLTCKFK